MSNRLSRAWHELKGTSKPVTRVVSGGGKPNYFEQRGRSREHLQKLKTIYDQGGIVAETIDCYPLYMLSNGWRLEGDKKYVKQVEDFTESVNFENILHTAILDTVVLGDSFQENVFNMAGQFDDIALRDSSTFDIVNDSSGKIIEYIQYLVDNGTEYKTSIPPNQITHLKFIGLGGSVYGRSIIDRAFDDIMRDTRTAESTATAIERHGFKKYHVKIGLEGEDIPQEVLDYTAREFRKLKTETEWATSHDVDILNIDEGGLDKVDTYNDISMTRMAAAMGVPQELIGTRRLPANVKVDSRIDNFFRKLSAYQRKVSRCYELNVFDQITEPGTVKLVLNDISPHDEFKKAEWMAKLIATTPLDPFAILPQGWVKSQFDIDPEAYDEEDDYIGGQQRDEAEPDTDENDTE